MIPVVPVDPKRGNLDARVHTLTPARSRYPLPKRIKMTAGICLQDRSQIAEEGAYSAHPLNAPQQHRPGQVSAAAAD